MFELFFLFIEREDWRLSVAFAYSRKQNVFLTALVYIIKRTSRRILFDVNFKI